MLGGMIRKLPTPSMKQRLRALVKTIIPHHIDWLTDVEGRYVHPQPLATHLVSFSDHAPRRVPISIAKASRRMVLTLHYCLQELAPRQARKNKFVPWALVRKSRVR